MMRPPAVRLAGWPSVSFLVPTGAGLTLFVVPLVTLPDADLRSELVIYTGRVGALVDLAMDLANALGLSYDLVVLDDHREPTTLRPALVACMSSPP